ncbi:MAG: SpoIIE family protein phosphatase [Cyclobacteriaceae bacterium]
MNAYFDQAVNAIRVIQGVVTLQRKTDDQNKGLSASTITQNEELIDNDQSMLQVDDLIRLQEEIFGFEHILIISPEGSIKVSTLGLSGNFTDPDGVTFKKSQTGIYVSHVRQDNIGYHSYVAGPVKTHQGTQLLLIKLNLNEVFKIFSDKKETGHAGEIFLAQHDPSQKDISLLNPVSNKFLIKAIRENSHLTKKSAAAGSTIALPQSKEFRDNPVFEEIQNINHTNLFLVAQLDADEALGNANQFFFIFWAPALCVITFLTLLGINLSRSSTMPVISPIHKPDLVRHEILGGSVEKYNLDEVDQQEGEAISLKPTFTEKPEFMPMESYEIAERKMIELDFQRKNRKITESIIYAKRIQSAILPNARLINRVLPDSFILYKPLDVVSGDFPWFAQVKNEIFIAAVDCTGHGVPGALLSLIGYFLLNDIVRSRKVTEPGKILDLLDEGVTATLRQDEEASTKDGMDISFCKINLARREVEYAGAHRPLYIMKSGVLEEIKGNKFPIGGGIFKNQTNFTNFKIKLSKGDSIYFCSDGFPDQFGGPQTRKFGQRKMREIMEKIYILPMKEAMQVFEDEWTTWKGHEKQTDDVLLMGVRF